MASCRRKSKEDAGRDVISELPVEVKERILECLPTRDAARTALLSTQWNEVWLRHGQLVFDKDFLKCLSKYECEKAQFAFVLQLLQNSPNLCQLKIMALNCLCSCDLTTGTSLLEEQNCCIIKQDLKILNTIIIVGFSGFTLEMLFVKMLLTKSPTLERVAIMEYVDTDIEDTSEDVNSWRKELLCFPRASPKAQLVCTENDDSVFELFDYMWF